MIQKALETLTLQQMKMLLQRKKLQQRLSLSLLLLKKLVEMFVVLLLMVQSRVFTNGLTHHLLLHLFQGLSLMLQQLKLLLHKLQLKMLQQLIRNLF
jgi:hypothetical protein